jgi:hypothetical protein
VPLATLSNLDLADPAFSSGFSWDHDQLHKQNLGAMTPLNRFNLPYFIDPFVDQSSYHMRHAFAHGDMLTVLPSYFGAEIFGLPSHQYFFDANMVTPETRSWNVFANHQEHFIANQSLPLVLVFG